MTNYSAWDSKAEALAKAAEEDSKREEAESNRALGLENGAKGPATAKSEAELRDQGTRSQQRKDFIAWSASRELELTHGAQEEPLELTDVEGKAVRLSASEGLTYVLNTTVVKLMLDRCRNVSIRVLGAITTSTLEVYRCSGLDVELARPLGTLQVDECEGKVCLRYAERDHVGCIYHQNSPGLSIAWGEACCEVGQAGPVQLCTRLEADGAKTVPVRRDESEYPVDLAGGRAPEQQPEPEQAPEAERRQQLAEQRRQAGNDMFRANDFVQAAVHYSESLQLDSSVGAVWANRAQCWLKMGDHDKALADAEKCTQVEPANPKGWFRKGMSLHALKRFPEAIPALLEAEKLEPHNKQVVDAIKMAQLMARKSA
eukprot:CAMPEP_0171101826 /NCGR_PEP_ID=MMETSP0766_2-20121228/56090_1 /TAXON_ID=439317 /ORGANISM="Gambierdiscus australes, Strain CAWD 149" /LENGTH=371 /DNA_ID=CAMNT_0011561967 /DNA_START=29 /DNA_END=1144 /DNA_ORIENTATION=+